MRRTATLGLTALLLVLYGSHADALDVPELHLQLGQLPPDASKPAVTHEAAGTELTTQLGPATLTIYRDNAAAPPGSDVAEPQYRASLDARFDRSIDSKSQGAPTSVGGHSGWTVISVHPAAGSVLYTCLTYVLVQEHLYRLTVRAQSTHGRPQEFDSLVGAMSAVSFEPPAAASAPPAA